MSAPGPGQRGVWIMGEQTWLPGRRDWPGGHGNVGVRLGSLTLGGGTRGVVAPGRSGVVLPGMLGVVAPCVPGVFAPVVPGLVPGVAGVPPEAPAPDPPLPGSCAAAGPARSTLVVTIASDVFQVMGGLLRVLDG